MTTTIESPPEQSAEKAPPVASATNVLVGFGLNEATIQRIRDAGTFDVSTEEAHVERAALLAITTRSDRGQTPKLPADIDSEKTPIVVICHPGGEEAALALMKKGCTAVIAEGNEAALASYLNPETHTEILVEGFLENQSKGRGGAGNRHRDPITNLPEVASFEMRLGEFIEAGTPPNVVMVQIANLEKVKARTDSRAVNLLRRRLASFYKDLATQHSCEVFSLSESTFAILDGSHGLTDTEGFANELIEITEAFRPAGTKLQLAVGAVHATADSEVMSIREQAEQAVMAAAQAEESAFVTADQVTVLLASATEYNVAQLLVSLVDEHGPYPAGHSGRVADLASDMAREIGFQGRDLSDLRLAALLHDVGRIPVEGRDEADEEDYPERGAQYVLASAGPEIADAIRYQAEHWDGKGQCGLFEDEIPLAARLIALADAVDGLLHPMNPSAALSPAEMLTKIEAESGSHFDPGLAATALRLFGGS